MPQHQIILLLFLLVISQSLRAENPKISLIIPDTAKVPFWASVSNFAKATAEDLNIDLKVVFSKGNSYSLKKDILAEINATEPPDYLLSIYTGTITKEFMTKAAARGIKYFIINSVINKRIEKVIGLPKSTYRNWVASIGPNDELAGFTLADILISEAKAKGLVNSDGKVHIAAITGPPDSHISVSRYLGLHRRLNSRNDAILIKAFASDWNKDSGSRAAQSLLNQHDNIHAIWSISDIIALATKEHIQSIGKTPGKDILLAGIDWNDQALQSVLAGEMTGSIGGHFMDAGWAVILIHDLHKGIKFTEDPGRLIENAMSVINAENIRQYMDKLGDRNWQSIDFKQFSKFYNKKLASYDFSLNAVLQQTTQNTLQGSNTYQP